MGGYKLPWDPLEEQDPFIGGAHEHSSAAASLLPATLLPAQTVGPTSASSGRLGLKLPKIGKVTFSEVWRATLEFFSHPVNIAITVWMLLCVPACVIIGLQYAGLLKKLIPDPKEAEKWVEICTQVVNALFVLACLVVLPLLIRQTIQLVRWLPPDKIELRQFYCKNGTRKPHDRTHMAIVVFFGHITCQATFVFSAVFWVFPVGERPEWLVNTTFAVSWLAPLISLFYLLLSPLSKNYDIVKEADAHQLRMFERSTLFVNSKQQAIRASRWDGKVCPGCCSNPRVATCACLLPCCMFGYNMERLGLGNRAVHTSAFMVVLVGPIMVFAFSAASLAKLGVPFAILLLAGLGLGLAGLAYGGLWRTKMRQRYGLPGSLCGDLCAWMWCSLCALCQEIRTAEQYDVQETSMWTLQLGSQNPGLSSGPQGVHVVPMEQEDFPFDDKAGAPSKPQFKFSRTGKGYQPTTMLRPLPDQSMEF